MRGLKDKADIASIGLEMGGCVVVGALFGQWVDAQLGTEPWGTTFFLVCGFGAAIKGLLRVAERARRVCATPVDARALLPSRSWDGTHR